MAVGHDLVWAHGTYRLRSGTGFADFKNLSTVVASLCRLEYVDNFYQMTDAGKEALNE